MIFHSYVNVYQGVAIDRYGQFQLVDGSRRVFGGIGFSQKAAQKTKNKIFPWEDIIGIMG